MSDPCLPSGSAHTHAPEPGFIVTWATVVDSLLVDDETRRIPVKR